SGPSNVRADGTVIDVNRHDGTNGRQGTTVQQYMDRAERRFNGQNLVASNPAAAPAQTNAVTIPDARPDQIGRLNQISAQIAEAQAEYDLSMSRSEAFYAANNKPMGDSFKERAGRFQSKINQLGEDRRAILGQIETASNQRNSQQHGTNERLEKEKFDE